ncbi:MAG: DUF222 domain-containing protein [Actinomycetota bacterium]
MAYTALRRVVTDLGVLVAGDDLLEAEADELAAVVNEVRRLERLVAVIGVRVARRAEELAAAGEGPGAIETMLATGEISGRRARREAARATLISWWPEVGEALVEGVIGPPAVDALARQTERLSDERRLALPQSELLDKAASLPVDTFARLLGRVVARVETEGDTPVDKRAQSSFRHWFDDTTGMGRFAGSFDPERYEAFTSAVEQHLGSIAAAAGQGVCKGPGLAADALFDLVTGAGARSSHLPHITVVVDPRGVAETGDGHPLAPDALRRLSCDAWVQRVTLDERGVPIDVGRRLRTATPAQWTAIRSLHRTCAWAGCTQSLSRCQLHHVRPWSRGGSTDLDNLLPLCSHHHHLVHEGGWSVVLAPDRALTITAPDGRHTGVPPPRRCDHPVASGDDP